MTKTVFHLGVTEADLNGATLAIIPGDPARVQKIAELMDNPVFLAAIVNIPYTGRADGQSVVVCHGIGGRQHRCVKSSTLGVRTFLRVGTTGAIQPHVNVGDMIVTTGSVRLDGASLHFAPMEFPAVPDFDVATAMKAAAQESGATVHMGVTASSDTFYPGQERYDTFTGRVVRRFQGSMKEWQDMGVLNFEMESATLLTMCASSGLKAGCVAGVIINRTQKEIPDHATLKETEARSIKVVVEAARKMLK
ncbi:uridine phosphorylase [Vibrio cholerae CT 5369-93]|nr:uridine phosphorylase [Vibrio cholerae CT 5369-93]